MITIIVGLIVRGGKLNPITTYFCNYMAPLKSPDFIIKLNKGDLQPALRMRETNGNKCLHLYLQTNIVIPFSGL